MVRAPNDGELNQEGSSMIRTIAMMFAVGVLAACGPGEMGPPGPAGPQGPTGPQGTPGIGLKSQSVCTANGTIGTVTILGLHYRTDFADGSAFITCELYATNASGRRDSTPTFYRAADLGNADGTCSINHDVDTSNGSGQGRFDFSAQKGATLGQLTYDDDASQYGGLKLSMTCTTF